MIEQIGDGLKSPMISVMVIEIFLLILFHEKRNATKRKQEDLIQNILFGIVLVASTYWIDLFLIDPNTSLTMFEMPICIFAGILYTKAVLNEKSMVAIYDTIWCFFLSELTVQIEMPIIINLWKSEKNIHIIIIDVLIVVFLFTGIIIFTRRFLLNQIVYLHEEKNAIFTIFIAVFYLFLSNYQLLFYILESKDKLTMIMIYRMICCLFCISLIYLQCMMDKTKQAALELGFIEQLWHRKEEQYSISQENIETINRKCHDMKHQIQAIRKISNTQDVETQLKEMENEVLIYDASIRTENEVLNIVLTEKSLFCAKHQIRMSCMIDASNLEFINVIDLYTIFGNALDNAIEYVQKEEDTCKRFIQVHVFTKNQFVLIEIENYFDKTLIFEDEIPCTTKLDKRYHGYGLKSIRHTAEKYGGGIQIQMKEKSFRLQILIPIKSA